MSTTFPDVNITRGGRTLTIQTAFEAGSGAWTTMVIDKAGELTGCNLGAIVVGQTRITSHASANAVAVRDDCRRQIRSATL